MTAELDVEDGYSLVEITSIQVPPENDTVSVLHSDEALERNFGHLSPEELVISGISATLQRRVCQLQMAAIRAIPHDAEAACAWLACYHQITGQQDYDQRAYI